MATALPLPPPSDEKVDGRRARRHRSRDQAIDALLDLLGEGVVRPTAQQVAERSGVSLRSIFRIFDDVETLHTEAAERQLQRHRHLFRDVPGDGPLEERIAAVVDLFDELHASVAHVRRAGLRAAPESPALQSQLHRVRLWARGVLEAAFASELAAVRDPADREEVAAAVELAVSFEAWDQCTTAQGLDPDARRAIPTRVLRALLA